MKHFVALLFVAAVLAQSPRKEQWLQIKEASPSKVVRQDFKDGTIKIFDTDGSIDSTLSDNVLTLNDDTGAQRSIVGGNSLGGCGYATLKSGTILSEVTRVDIQCSSFTMLTAAGSTRVRITPDIAGSISRMELLSGGVTLVDFQAGGSGGTFKVALDATGANGVSATTGGLLYAHNLGFYDAAGSLPIGLGIAGFGRGGGGLIALPNTMGSTGDCFVITDAATGQHGYAACGGAGSFVTLNTAQTGAVGITNSKTFYGDGVQLNGQSNTSFLQTWLLTQNGAPRLQFFENGGTKLMVDMLTSATAGEVWTHKENPFFPTLAPKAAGLSGDTVFGLKLLLGTDPSGFNFRGWEVPAAAAGSIVWKMPLSDAAGCWQSDGAGNTSISACPGGGVTSVSGSGLISSTGGTTPIISCPNCANTNTGNFFAGLNVFNGTLRLTAGAETLFPITTSSYDLGTSVRRWNTLYVGGINTAGFNGIGLVCLPGNYLFEPTFINGILTAGTCSL
jgi:hypothetical protein